MSYLGICFFFSALAKFSAKQKKTVLQGTTHNNHKWDHNECRRNVDGNVVCFWLYLKCMEKWKYKFRANFWRWEKALVKAGKMWRTKGNFPWRESERQGVKTQLSAEAGNFCLSAARVFLRFIFSFSASRLSHIVGLSSSVFFPAPNYREGG